MTENRIYRLVTDLERHTYVNIGGKDVYVAFTGGTLYPRKVHGSFSTSDPSIQKALETDNRYGRVWVCINKKTINKAPVVERAEQPQEDFSQNAVGEIPKVKSVPEIKTVQDAKEYLASRLDGVTKASLTNKAKVLEVAADYGFEFPNLP